MRKPSELLLVEKKDLSWKLWGVGRSKQKNLKTTLNHAQGNLKIISCTIWKLDIMSKISFQDLQDGVLASLK
jgi:hypothetical protein